MEIKDPKVVRIQRIKGLLGRIILACIIFIFLFIGRLLSLEILQYSTDSIIEQLQNNDWLDYMEEKIKS